MGFPLNAFFPLPRYVSQTCPEHQLIRHQPPLVYDLYRDPFELYPLVNTGTEGVVSQVLRKAEAILNDHRRSIVAVPEQLGHFSRDVTPVRSCRIG